MAKRGHRRIANELVDRYWHRPALLRLLLAIDLDAARRRIRTPNRYEHDLGVHHRTARRLIAEYLELRPELDPKRQRSAGKESRDPECLRESWRGGAQQVPNKCRTNPARGRGVARKLAGEVPNKCRGVLNQNQNSEARPERRAPDGHIRDLPEAEPEARSAKPRNPELEAALAKALRDVRSHKSRPLRLRGNGRAPA